MKKLSICIAGKNQIAIDGLFLALEHFDKSEVCVCPNSTDDGVSHWQPSLIRYARELGVKVCNLKEIYEVEDIIFISLEFDRIISPDRFKTKKLYNIHFSLLPRYKGVYTSAWPILNGSESSGVTLHEIDAGIDTGPIVDQIEFSVSQSMTSRDLYFKYMQTALTVLKRNFKAILENRINSKPQSSEESTYFSRKSINYAELMIDVNNTALSIQRQVRAFSFREFQLPILGGHKVCNPKILSRRSVGKPGVINYENGMMRMSSIDFDVQVQIDDSWEVFDLLKINDVEGIGRISDVSKLDLTNKNGWTPLMVSIYYGNLPFSKALIKHGANISKSNQNGTTPLMYAKSYGVSSGDFSLARMLIDAGADIDCVDKFGKNVIDYSKLNNEIGAMNFFGVKND